MGLKKNKIWIISIILINLIFIVFLQNYKIENTYVKDNFNRVYNDNLPNLQSSSIDWYNADWQYRKVINITTGATAVPSNYSISLTFDHATLVNLGKSRADGNDIKVVYDTGSDWDDLDRVLDPGSSWNNDSTIIWFKIQTSIAAFSSDSNYYLYYGNPLAALPPTNGSNIFLFYDGFESGDFSAWDYVYEGGGDTINIVSSPVHTGTSTAEAYVDNVGVGQTYVETQLNGERTFHSIVYTYIPSSWSGAQYISHIQYYGMYNENSEQVGSITIPDNLEPYAQIWDPNVGYNYYFGNTSLTTDEWHRLEIKLILSSTNISYDGRVELWQDGVQTVNESEVYMPHDYISYKDVGIYWDQSAEETIYFDDCFDKLWIDPEPITTLCTEEKFRPSISDFKYYKEIIIDHTKVSGTSDLSNFPILISIFDSDLHDHAQPDGDDIAFYNGTDWLFHEIEVFNQCYNSTHAQLVAWVRIPSLSCTVDTIITMYYGNSTMGSQEYPDRVWDSDYKGVWHLKEDPSVSKIKDSTINSYHGTSYGSMTSSNQLNGQIGGSMKFDGLNDYINLGSASGLKLTDAFTFEVWYSGIYNSTVNTRSPIFTNGFSYTNSIGIRVEAFHSTAGSTNREARIAVGDGSNFNYLISDYEINDNTWTYLVCTYDGSTLKLYINGTKQIDELNTNIAYNANNATIGRNVNNAEQWYKGLVDEVRFLAKNCSAEWIATEYNNQYDPNSFYSIGMEKTTLAHNTNYFAYYKLITINSTKVSGSSDLINFPILLSIFDSDLHNHAQVDGDDIAFYSGGKWLDHEIEIFNRSYSGTQAQLVTWIRIPFLSSSVNTEITMYYGNSTMGSQENPNGAWNPNFVGVWHLDESGTGVVNEYIDSSHYGNHGQGGSGNVSYVPDRTTGVIGFGQDFVDNFIDCDNATSLDITTNQITMQLWMKYPATHPWMGPFNHKGYNEGYRLVMDENSQYLNFQLPGYESDLQTSQIISTDEWHYVVATYNGSLMRIYVDGVPDSANLTKMNNIESALPAPFRIGHGDHPEGVAWSYPWLGQIDEVRISNIGRSAEWIATEYNNQYDPDNFYSIGIENQNEADTSAPDITINSPNPNDLFGSNAPDYDLTVIDANLDSIWYSLDGGTTNSTPVSASGTIDQTMWSAIANGTVPIRFYANDTLGHVNYEEVIVRKDIINPSVIINSPTPSSSHSTPPSYSLSIIEANLDKIWYTLDEGLNNYTGAISGTIDSTAWGYAGLGAVTIMFYVNDSVGNWNFTSVGIIKTSDLSISINTPKAAEWFNSNPDYEVYVNGNDRDSIWYTIDNGINNYTITNNANQTSTWFGAIDAIAWGNASQGSITLTFYLNNTYGMVISDSLQINKDSVAPSINSIDSPFSGVWFSSNPPEYSLTITETNVDEIWYTLDGGSTNYTGVSGGTIDTTAWSNAGQGSVTITFYINDSASNWDSASVIINRDTIDPLINNIDSPLSAAWFNSNPPEYSLTITETNVDEIWYTLDGGTTNYTGASGGAIDSTAWSNAGEGSVTIIFYVNDSAGNWDSASVIIYRDSIDPIITIIEPHNYDLFGTTPPDINININDSNLDGRWYKLDNGTVTTNNYTWVGFLDQSVWDQFGNGTVIIRFYANDTVGNLANAEVIVYKDINLPIITIINPSLSEVHNATAPSFIVSISGSNLDTTWYTLNNGVNNYTFTGLTGSIDQSAWISRADGMVTIKFYINNTLGVLDFDEVDIIKDTIAPQISLNLPLNNTYCGDAPFINALVTDANLNTIWYEINTSYVLLTNNVNQQLETSIWSNLFEGEFYIYIYANDSARNLSDPLIIRLYKDTSAPSAPNLISFPQGVVSGNLLFEWEEGSDPSGISKYRLIIDNEANPFVTPGFVFETNVTGSSYSFTGNLQPGTYHFFLYQIDGVGHQSSASTGSFSISSNTGPSEFPIWIIFIIIGAAIGGVVSIVVLKKSKSKKVYIAQTPEKKPVIKPVLEMAEDFSQLDYDILKVMSHDELIDREEILLEHIRYLEESKKYGKAAEIMGELIFIEEFLGNSKEVKLYRQKQIDMAIKGLEYLKDQYEIESKKSALSGDYSKALELYNESKVISVNLKSYKENQEPLDMEESAVLETIEPQPIIEELEIVYSCMNDLLTKYFDDIGIKYYSNLQIYENISAQIHGLILADQLQLELIDSLVREKIKTIQIIFTEDISDAKVIKLCQTFYNPYALLLIVGIKWPNNIEAQTVEIPLKAGIENQENIRIIHYELFMASIGLKDAYETAFKEIIDLYNKSEVEVLRETRESSEIIIHNMDELRYDLREKGLIRDKLEEYFNR
ncbi:MAG: DUF2341 domain-containing protein [Candidatus Odinarchaeota archaeon]